MLRAAGGSSAGNRNSEVAMFSLTSFVLRHKALVALF